MFKRFFKFSKSNEDDLNKFAEFSDSEDLQRKIDEQKIQLHLLEKEVGYWKEKALNFKRFHQ